MITKSGVHDHHKGHIINILQEEALNLHCSLKKDEEKRQHMVSFVGKMLDQGHAVAPPLMQDEETWYLPLFGVYNPRKPGKIRVVF
jgi:hypothetical protein